jgi:hypothetical protein
MASARAPSCSWRAECCTEAFSGVDVARISWERAMKYYAPKSVPLQLPSPYDERTHKQGRSRAARRDLPHTSCRRPFLLELPQVGPARATTHEPPPVRLFFFSRTRLHVTVLLDPHLAWPSRATSSCTRSTAPVSSHWRFGRAGQEGRSCALTGADGTSSMSIFFCLCNINIQRWWIRVRPSSCLSSIYIRIILFSFSSSEVNTSCNYSL